MRIPYTCTIGDSNNAPDFTVSFKRDQLSEPIKITESTASGVFKIYGGGFTTFFTAAWRPILSKIERSRASNSEQLKLFASAISGDLLFGLTEMAITKMIESLPGVETILTYTFKHGGQPLMELPLAVNPSGCARCEPRFRTYVKNARARHEAPRPQSAAAVRSRPTVSNEDYASLAAAGEHVPATAKWSAYKKMKQGWRNNVYLARSKIQGLGLYAKRDIDMGTMIIEYLGEVVRDPLTDVREQRYNAHNRGVYMFRIDGERVVDATMAGGAPCTEY